MKTLYKLKLCILAIIGLLALNSCSTEDPISSVVTYYPLIELNSPEMDTIFVIDGAVYEEPGAVATIDDQEVPLTTTYEGLFRNNTFNETLDTSVSDFYTVRYSAENEDGFTGSSTRTVIVANTGDLVNSIEGLYRSTVTRNGSISAEYIDMEYVLIWKENDNTYGISDTFGGYYDIGRAYGPTYITPGGTIVANDISSNDFSFPGTQTNSSFGGASEITSMTVNPEDNSIDMVVTWDAGTAFYTFDIHLEQVQF